MRDPPDARPRPRAAQEAVAVSRQYPNIIDAYDIFAGEYDHTAVELPLIGYKPARPLGASFHWLRATWLVFTGRADALVWPGQGDR